MFSDMARKRKQQTAGPAGPAGTQSYVPQYEENQATIQDQYKNPDQIDGDDELEEEVHQAFEDDSYVHEEDFEGEDFEQGNEQQERVSESAGEARNDGHATDGDKDEEEVDYFDDETVENLLEPFGKDQLVVLLKRAISKYPELISLVREIADADPGHRKIFVHGLGWDATAETLKSVFGKFGEIEDCKNVVDRVSGKSKGYAFILFKRRAAAQRALKEPQKKIGNRITSCQLATIGPVPAPPPVVPQVSEYTQRKIFVSNVAEEIDPEKLLVFFKQFGEVEEGPLGLDKVTGKPKGFCLFVYKSVESAKKALEEPHKNFEGHVLHCQKAIDGPKPNKPGLSGASGGSGFNTQQYQHSAKKGKFGSAVSGQGHLMAPSGPSVGFNSGLNPVLGQALTALLASQGAGLGNLLGGLGAVNQGGSGGGYVTQGAGFGNQQGLQSLYQNQQSGQNASARPHHGQYMGH